MLFGKMTGTPFLNGGIDPTRFQMHVQVKRQLMDRLSLILSEKEITPLASYLSAVVLASIDEVLQPVEPRWDGTRTLPQPTSSTYRLSYA